MAFIEKKDPVVLNIKLTSKGRELLSEGNLTFKYFAVGDSEIDYAFNSEANAINPLANLPFSSMILRPADKNPDILSFITRTKDGSPFNAISSVPSTPTIIQNTAPSLGFFNITSGSTSFIIDGDHVKQPDIDIYVGDMDGSNYIYLYPSLTYGVNVNQPVAGDYLLIKMTNPSGYSTSGYGVDLTAPMPYLMYKITEVDYGTLSDNGEMGVYLDRNLPNNNGNYGFVDGAEGGNDVVAGGIVFYNHLNYSGDTLYNYYSTDYLSESVIAFLQNAQCPSITYPYWNMSIIFTEEIAGVQLGNTKYGQFNTNVMGGFVSYIQNQAPIYKKLGVIHYTNSSPSNTYAEELYKNTPTLDIPTIMWHKSSTAQLGVTLKAYGSMKTLTGATRSLNTTYYDLADLNGYVVGKVFNDLKLFVIEDQELLFAMSYKSNRSWTLPMYSIGVNDSITDCPVCSVTFSVAYSSPQIIGTNTGGMSIHNIHDYIDPKNLVLSVSGETRGLIYFEPVATSLPILIHNLYGDVYHVVILDMNTMTNTCQEQIIDISEPQSILSIYDLNATPSGLDPDFKITYNPDSVNIKVNLSDIGLVFGTPTAAIVPYGSTSFIFNPFVAGSVQFDGLTLRSAYTIAINDDIDTGFTRTKNYVAVGSPFNELFLTSSGNDSDGNYILISNYILPIVNTVNPIIGAIEFCAYSSTGTIETGWQQLPITSNLGDPMKLYVKNGSYKVVIREIDSVTGLVASEVARTITHTSTSTTTTITTTPPID